MRTHPKIPPHATKRKRSVVVHYIAGTLFAYPVWQVSVDRGTWSWWDEGSDGEEQVGEEEEDGDGEGGADSGGPVGEARFVGEVDPDEAGRHEDVDDREGVGNETFDGLAVVSERWMRGSLLDQEVISITWRGCQHDDN